MEWAGESKMFNWMRIQTHVCAYDCVYFICCGNGLLHRRSQEADLAGEFVLDSSAFVQEWFYRPAGYIAGLFEDIANLHDIYKENEQLRIAAAAYARDSIKFNYIEEEE